MQLRQMYVITAPRTQERRGQKLHIFAMDTFHAKYMARTEFGWDYPYLNVYSYAIARALKNYQL